MVKYPKATVGSFIRYFMQVLINCQGTLPFASLHILQQISDCDEPSISHTAADDLESFFYVFMWLCVLHDGPNGSVRPWPKDEDFIVHAWGEGAMRPGGLVIARNAKSHFIYSPNTIIDKQFTLYFDNLKPLAMEWKELVKEEDEHRQSRPPALDAHHRIIALLHKYTNTLPDFDSVSLSNHHDQKSSTYLTPAVSLAVPAALKRPSSFPVQQLSKRRRCFSLGSIGTAWEPRGT